MLMSLPMASCTLAPLRCSALLKPMNQKAPVFTLLQTYQILDLKYVHIKDQPEKFVFCSSHPVRLPTSSKWRAFWPTYLSVA